MARGLPIIGRSTKTTPEMKVYWAGIFEGDYIRSLQEAVENSGVEIGYAHDQFINQGIPTGTPIHLHWLEAYGTDSATAGRLREALVYYSTRNPLIWTVHNLQPHGMDVQRGRAFYRALIPYLDHAIHLGPKSMELLEAVYDIPKQQTHHLCPHHILPHQPEPDVLPPWGERTGIWITLGRLRSPGDKYLLGSYIREGQGRFEALYIHRYPHLIQRQLLTGGWRHPRLLWQEARMRWWDQRVHLNFKSLSVAQLSAWLTAADRLLLPRTQHLNSGIPFLAAPFRIPIQVPDVGNIPWQLHQLGYERADGDLFVPRGAPNWEEYQHHAISKWVGVYREVARQK